MSNVIISNSSVSQEQILRNINEWVKTLPNYNDIKDNLNTSTMSVIYQLLAGFSSWNFYNYQMNRAETYLSTATQDKSVYTIARQFGYNLDRGMSPVLVCTYDNVETITLKSGDVIGSYGDLDVVYFGVQRFVEKGDVVEFFVGKYSYVDKTVQNSASELLRDRLTAETLNYIDNLRVYLTIDRDVYIPTKQVENFVVKGEAIDFSVSPRETDIYLMDTQYKYGLYNLQDGTPYKIEYLETDGYSPNISVDSVEMISGWICLSISSQGTNPEPVEKLRAVAPFYYSTMRRAVTKNDYDYLSKSNSLVLDTYAEREKGTPGVYTIQFKSLPVNPGDIFTISIRTGVTYSYTANQGDTLQDVMNALISSVNLGEWAIATEESADTIRLENRDARLDFNPTAGTNKFESPVQVVAQVSPPCCTVVIYYIKFNQTRDLPIQVMTESERDIYANYVQTFKGVGTSIILVPAGRESRDISLKIGLTDKTLILDDGTSIMDYFRNKVRDVLDEYELKLNTYFSYAEFLAKITKISVEVGFDTIQPTYYATANQDVFDLPALENKYYIFPNLTIEFE